MNDNHIHEIVLRIVGEVPYYAECEIVRCYNCCYGELKYGLINCHGKLAAPWDYYNDEPNETLVNPDGFCAWGVKRDTQEFLYNSG